jgi:hypothetical protein
LPAFLQHDREVLMIRGSCLCGAVRFEVARVAGPFELCHCSRCRKVSGGAHLAGIYVETEHYRLLSGRELIREFALPVREQPPAYCTFFCSRCGSPTPEPAPRGAWTEIPAGLLDDDPGLRPDRHIFVDYAAPWDGALDALPRLTKDELHALRSRGSE